MRPLSVTIVGWWLVLGSLLAVYPMATMNSDPVAVQVVAWEGTVPMETQQIFGIINCFMLAFCGLAILYGRWWSRLLFVGWSLIGFFFGLATVGLILAFCFSALSVGPIMFFLSRPHAQAWFSTMA